MSLVCVLGKIKEPSLLMQRVTEGYTEGRGPSGWQVRGRSHAQSSRGPALALAC